MKVNHLNLVNFRNYQKANIDIDQGINLLYGNNASGKTNLVEAISFASLGKSFRTNDDSNLIMHQNDGAKIELEYFSKKKNRLDVILSKEGKIVYHNDIKLERLSELNGLLITITFTPEDVLLFKDSPSVRRRFLDIACSNLYRGYIKQLSDYKNVLKQRNALLKNEIVDERLLEIFNEGMIDNQYQIMLCRYQILKKLEEKLNLMVKRITNINGEVKIKYQCDFDLYDSIDDFRKNVLDIYSQDKEQDLKRKTTSRGVHHDDFKLYLENKEVSEFASQGQNRLLALCLKLSYGELIKEQINENPVIILDDVLSELDNQHQAKLINVLKEYEQVFITSAEDEDIEGINKYQVIDGMVLRRN